MTRPTGRFKWQEALPEVCVIPRDELLTDIYYNASPRDARIKTREILYRNIWLRDANRQLFDNLAKYLAQDSDRRKTMEALDRTFANLDELEESDLQPRHLNAKNAAIAMGDSTYKPRHLAPSRPSP